MMVISTQRKQILEVGRTVVLIPLGEVVNLAVIELALALTDRTGAMHRS